MEPIREYNSNAALRRSRRRAEFGYGFALVQNPVWTLSQVLLATGGRLWGDRTQAAFRLISTDSRTIEAGDLFVALRGENFDAQQFVAEAVAKGAAGLVLEQPPVEPVPVPVVLVPDTLAALGDLAHYRRCRMRELQVLAITGSSGKTTVKEMTATILQRRQQVLKTRGNLNNLVGLPLSLLPVEHSHRFAVLEMGMNRPGEIARMAEIALPDIACITNVQEAHLAGLADVQGVARAKGELFAGLPAWGKLVVNLDDKRVRRLAARTGQQRITYGRTRNARVRATYIRSLGEAGMSFTLTIDDWRQRVRLAALGEHNVSNALAAAALATAAGVSPAEIAAGLAAYRPFAKRMQLLPFIAGLKLIDDTYNANPSSMLAALATVHNLRRQRRVVAVLGDMLELGEQSVAAHRFIGGEVARLDFDYLLAVGEFAHQVVAAARHRGMAAARTAACADKEEIVARLRRMVDAGELAADDIVLFKGSRGMRMETIIDGARSGT